MYHQQFLGNNFKLLKKWFSPRSCPTRGVNDSFETTIASELHHHFFWLHGFNPSRALKTCLQCCWVPGWFMPNRRGEYPLFVDKNGKFWFMFFVSTALASQMPWFINILRMEIASLGYPPCGDRPQLRMSIPNSLVSFIYSKTSFRWVASRFSRKIWLWRSSFHFPGWFTITWMNTNIITIGK